MRKFAGKVAVVTGAASGIGLAMAQRFAAEGMLLVLADIDQPALDRTVRDLADRTAAVGVCVDVSQAEGLDNLAARAYDAFGAVHILCNNAGIGGPLVPCWELEAADWDRVLAVNLWSVIHGIRAFVPRMIAGGEDGHIVNTASMAGLLSMPHGAAYHASKHAVVTVTESLYYDLRLAGSALRASVLCPAFVRTGIMDAEIRRAAPEPPPNSAIGLRRQIEDGYLQGIASGMDPSEVAAQVLDAIRNEQLYILTHAPFRPAVIARAQQIAAAVNPDPWQAMSGIVKRP